MKIRIATILTVLSLVASSCCQTKEPVDYVNPYIGNISHLLVPTYPTVYVPNGMLRVIPNRDEYMQATLKGLPVVWVNHRGGKEFEICPWNGEGTDSYIYSYDYETIKPYEWDVLLDNVGVDVRFAPAAHSAIYSFEFTEEGTYTVTFKDGRFEYVDGRICGTKNVSGKDNSVAMYFVAEPSVAPAEVNDLNDRKVVLTFAENNVDIRYAVSYIDAEQALYNLNAEVAGKSLEEIAAAGRKAWNECLSKIQVKGGSEDEKSAFYTAVYRTYERPWCMSEYGRYYSAFDKTVHDDEGRPYYTDDWYWDTYRAAHPLRAIIEPETEQDMILSSVRAGLQSQLGTLPTFPLPVGDNHSMNSNHGIAVIADALSKGLDNFDVEAAYEVSKNALLKKTLIPWRNNPACSLDEFYWENGYFPGLPEGAKETEPIVDSFEHRQPIAVTLGTSYDCWAIAQIADRLGKTEDRDFFLNASLFYRNVFNEETRFFHPKDAAGNFIQPFDYIWSGGVGFREAYDENNGWTYRWDVQHNIADLVEMMGGADAFAAELDMLYTGSMGTNKYGCYVKSPDHSALVGLFSMGNEPCLHIPYLYNYAGQPWKTQKMTRTLLREWFRNDLMGIPGDEDGGGMSGFVAFTMMGLYPVTPGLPMYVITSPVFEETTINVGNGKTFTVKCVNYSADNRYIQSAKLNGKALENSWIRHSDLADGGVLELTMGHTANKTWASQPENCPPSFKME